MRKTPTKKISKAKSHATEMGAPPLKDKTTTKKGKPWSSQGKKHAKKT